jgi:hypothetical protein
MRTNNRTLPLGFLTGALLATTALLYPHQATATDYSSASIPNTFTFQTTLKQGDTIDPDVKYLQIILNSKPETRVTEEGLGSANEPSAYFGLLTRSAVMRFQELYKSEVLTPAGLTSPTGSVGNFTRMKLNALIGHSAPISTPQIQSVKNKPTNQINVVTGANKALGASTNARTDSKGIVRGFTGATLLNLSDLYSTTTTSGYQRYELPPIAKGSSGISNQGLIRAGSLYIDNLSTYLIKPNLVMSIFGAGFAQTNNNVFIGPVHIGSYSSNLAGSQLTFTVPDYMPRGFYQLAVSNVYGTTTSRSLQLTIDRPTSTESQVTRPTINSIIPSYTRFINDAIVITGQNYTTDNTITTNLGDIKHVVSSDGKNITFLVGSLPFFTKAQREYKGSAINLIIKISNENGASTETINHVINFPNSATPGINTEAQQAIVDLESTYGKPFASSWEIPASTSTIGTGSSTALPPGNATELILSKNVFRDTNTVLGNFPSNPYQILNYQGASLNNPSTRLTNTGIGLTPSAQNPLTSILKKTGPAVYFGGTIIDATACTCNGATLITVDDFVGNTTLSMLYSPLSSDLKRSFNIWGKGSYVAGSYQSGGGSCLVFQKADNTQTQTDTCISKGTSLNTVNTISGVSESSF